MIAASAVAAIGIVTAGDATGQGRANIVAFGLDGDQSVFLSEARGAAAAVAAKYGRGGNVIVAANVGANRAAMSENLRAAIQSAAGRSGPDDVLFLILTSHGSRAGLLVKSGATTEILSPPELGTMLDAAGVGDRVVIVSACYSGVFADALAAPHTLVMTASDDNHPSFGCRAGATWTDFGGAFFAQALPRTKGLVDAFAAARAIVSEREAALGLTPSNPQMAGGQAVLARLDGDAAPSVAEEAPFAPRAGAAHCELRAEPAKTVDGCEVFNGYSGGKLVGLFHLSGNRIVAAGGQCPSNYLSGRLLAPDKIAVANAVFTLAADCRSAAKSSR